MLSQAGCAGRCVQSPVNSYSSLSAVTEFVEHSGELGEVDS